MVQFFCLEAETICEIQSFKKKQQHFWFKYQKTIYINPT